MGKEIHFYEYEPNFSVFHSWDLTENQIGIGTNIINTTQMGLLSTELIEKGYRIFIHESEESSYEIVIGGKNERTNKALRLAHNLFKMWRAGTFDKKVGEN